MSGGGSGTGAVTVQCGIRNAECGISEVLKDLDYMLTRLRSLTIYNFLGTVCLGVYGSLFVNKKWSVAGGWGPVASPFSFYSLALSLLDC
jgi:hypothetical protein